LNQVLGGLQVAALTASPDQDHLLETRKRRAEENVLSNGSQARDSNGVRGRTLGPPAVDGKLLFVTRILIAVKKGRHPIQEIPIRIKLALEYFRWTGTYAQTAPGTEIADLRSRIQRDCLLRADFLTPPAYAFFESDLLTHLGRHRDA
jgi:hypothetical protein